MQKPVIPLTHLSIPKIHLSETISNPQFLIPSAPLALFFAAILSHFLHSPAANSSLFLPRLSLASTTAPVTPPFFLAISASHVFHQPTQNLQITFSSLFFLPPYDVTKTHAPSFLPPLHLPSLRDLSLSFSSRFVVTVQACFFPILSSHILRKTWG